MKMHAPGHGCSSVAVGTDTVISHITTLEESSSMLSLKLECLEYILLSLGIISTEGGNKPCELKKARDSFAVDFEWQSPRRVYRRKSRHRVLENAR